MNIGEEERGFLRLTDSVCDTAFIMKGHNRKPYFNYIAEVTGISAVIVCNT